MQKEKSSIELIRESPVLMKPDSLLYLHTMKACMPQCLHVNKYLIKGLFSRSAAGSRLRTSN